MLRLDALAAEIVLTIVEYLALPPHEFPAVSDSGAPPPLKSLSLSCRRLYAICFPYLFQSLRLSLDSGRSLSRISALRRFLRNYDLHRSVHSIAITLGPFWNDGKVGIELKKFLWELEVKALTLYKERGAGSTKEKSARWPYFLNTLERLKVETVDDDGELKMLLLRQCPARVIHVDDGDFRDSYDDTGSWSMHAQAPQQPAIAALKPSMFPNLQTLVYHATFPSYNRFDNFLEFAAKLPMLRHFTVTLMGGQDDTLDLRDVWYRPSPDALRYAEIICAYQILAHRVELMEGLGYLVCGDRRLPYKGDTAPPLSFDEVAPGIYQRRSGDVDGEAWTSEVG